LFSSGSAILLAGKELKLFKGQVFVGLGKLGCLNAAFCTLKSRLKAGISFEVYTLGHMRSVH